jgi:transcriptional regulator with XRE-family HTH domain
MADAKPSFGGMVRRLRVTGALKQADLAKRLGVKPQTIGRWEGGTRVPQKRKLRALLAIALQIDPASAARIAEARGSSLQALGLAPSVAAPPTSATVPLRHAADAVVLAGAEAADVPVATVRAIVRAAFARAREMGLSIDSVAQGLEPSS